jgi:hypothetical protein
MSHDVFVSYSKKDKEVADAICKTLEKDGIRCWIAPRDVQPGVEYADAIIEALNTCRVFLVILSGESNSSPQVRREVERAVSKDLEILTFRIDDAILSRAMEYYLSNRHWLDASNAVLSKQLHSLSVAIQKLLSQSSLLREKENNPKHVEVNEPVKPVPPTVEEPRPSAPTPLLAKPVPPTTEEPKATAPIPFPATPPKKHRLTWILAPVIMIVLAGLFTIGWLMKDDLPFSRLATTTPTITKTATTTKTPTLQVKTFIVTSAENGGAGTLRQALLDAKKGDTITFDAQIFPPGRPTTIFLTSETLPRISQGGITIDASNAGVILDGSKLPGISDFGLVINSDHNIVKGVQIVNISGSGIYLEGGSYNTIGGNRTIGTGPLGQGNLLSDNYIGISLLSMAGGNVITGNLIGTDVSGAGPRGNWKGGIRIEDNQSYHPAPNTIGPDNIIAYNGTAASVEAGEITGGVVMDTVLPAMTITGNSIYDNAGPGIFYNVDDAARIKYSTPPAILYFDLASGVVNGQACNDCIVEIFSTDAQDGKISEGTVSADEFGNFSFNKGEALTGPYLTATATRFEGNNTSEFSLPTSARSAIQIALDTIQNEAPLYQTSFDSWDFGDPQGNARIENGKLIITSESTGVVVENLNNYSSDRFAVEFEFRDLEANQAEGYCVFNYNNENVGIGESIRSVSASFYPSGLANMGHYVHPDQFPGFALSRYDILEGTKFNIVTLIILGEQIAVFANGQLAYTALNPDGVVVYTTYDFQVSNTMCEYDNYKFWDLSGVDFNP